MMYTLHECDHCRRIVLPHAGTRLTSSLRLPHTRRQARAAATDGCPIYNPLFSAPSAEEPACTRAQLARTMLNESLCLWQSRDCPKLRNRLSFLWHCLTDRPFRLILDDLTFCKVVSDERATLARWYVTSTSPLQSRCMQNLESVVPNDISLRQQPAILVRQRYCCLSRHRRRTNLKAGAEAAR